MRDDDDVFEEYISYLATNEEDELNGKNRQNIKRQGVKSSPIGCSLSLVLHLIGIAFIIFTFVKGSPAVGALIILIYLIFL